MGFSTDPRWVQSLPAALINGAINGAIAWSAFKGRAQVPLSMDSIAATGITALGNAATAAFALTFIIASITFFVFRSAARKTGSAPAALTALGYWPTGLGIALRNTLLVFGGFVAAAVLWQRAVGTVLVGPLAAALVVAAVAALATAVAEMRTKREMLAAPG
ncbi:MAG: hypothetical protein MUF16_17865 [Burkholderiaceae bacterium]|jgi:hypothetical protein|nr:hypothetical protein [Burkholderiaceae bacterium]